MPDLQTALSKVINEWEKPVIQPPTTNQQSQSQSQPNTGRAYFQVTNNVTRATFNYVRDNPGLQRTDVVRSLEGQGYKSTSTYSLILQLLRQGLFRVADGRLYATQSEYTPIKRVRATPQAHSPAPAKAPRTANRRPRAAALVPNAIQLAQPAAPSKPSVNELLHSLSISDARALYDELHKIFKG